MINWGSFLRLRGAERKVLPENFIPFYVCTVLEGESDFSSSVAFLSRDVSQMLDSVAIKRRFIRYGFVTVTNADSGGAGNRVTNPTAAGDSPNRAVVR